MLFILIFNDLQKPDIRGNHGTVRGMRYLWYSRTMIKLDDKNLKEFEAELKTFARRAYPFATKNTINKAVFETQKISRRDVSVKMVERNKFTKQSIQVDQARTLNVQQQAATVGSTAGYMEDQEFGTIKRKSGSKGVRIATGYSAGQEGQQPRTKLPRRPNKMQNIRLRKRRIKADTRKRRNISAIRQAATSGNKFVFLDLGKRQGIFKVTGGKRRPKIKMVQDMTEQSVTIPRNPWLKPAVDVVQLRMPTFYRDALIFQLKRQGLFRG